MGFSLVHTQAQNNGVCNSRFPVYLIRQRWNTTTAVTVPEYKCHVDGGPMDSKLRCDSSHHQIVMTEKRKYQGNHAQKRNLIILDIDYTILEAVRGSPSLLDARKLPFHEIHVGPLDLELLFIGFFFKSGTQKYSMVFRKYFFDFLDYVHLNSGFSADLVLYTRARPDYAREVALGIDECFKRKYRNMSSTDSLFKMVISSTDSNTAKTVSTLEYFLKLRKYQSIIILDDDGRNCWCKHRMLELKKHHKVDCILIQMPAFHVWEEANKRFKELSTGCPLCCSRICSQENS